MPIRYIAGKQRLVFHTDVARKMADWTGSLMNTKNVTQISCKESIYTLSHSDTFKIGMQMNFKISANTSIDLEPAHFGCYQVYFKISRGIGKEKNPLGIQKATMKQFAPTSNEESSFEFLNKVFFTPLNANRNILYFASVNIGQERSNKMRLVYFKITKTTDMLYLLYKTWYWY